MRQASNFGRPYFVDHNTRTTTWKDPRHASSASATRHSIPSGTRNLPPSTTPPSSNGRGDARPLSDLAAAFTDVIDAWHISAFIARHLSPQIILELGKGDMQALESMIRIMAMHSGCSTMGWDWRQGFGANYASGYNFGWN